MTWDEMPSPIQSIVLDELHSIRRTWARRLVVREGTAAVNNLAALANANAAIEAAIAKLEGRP